MPTVYYTSGGAPVYGNQLLDAAADRVACVFYAPKAGDIRKLGFMVGAVTKNATTTLVMSLQNVDLTTGNPDTTEDQTATIANADIVANTMVLSGNLSADRTVTAKELLAMVVRFGTFVAGDLVNIQTQTHGTEGQGPVRAEYAVVNLTGSYSKITNGMAVVEIEYSDGTHAYMPLQSPWAATSSDTFNNTSTPDEIGLQFQIPFPARLSACWLLGDMDGDFDLILYSASAKTTMKSVDKDVRSSLTAGVYEYHFATPVSLLANTTYVLALAPSSATSCLLRNVSVRAAVAWDQTCGGQTWRYATAKNPATTADFTATTTKRPVMGLVFDQVDDGVSAAGGGFVIGG